MLNSSYLKIDQCCRIVAVLIAYGMAEKLVELALPSAVVMRLLKDAIPEGINVSKEARSAVTRAAAVFVLYTTSVAHTIQLESSRKTLSANDVFLALKDTLFEDMVESLKESLELFQAEKGKKDNTTSSSPTKVGAPRGKRKKSVGSISKEIASSSIEIPQTDDLEMSDIVD